MLYENPGAAHAARSIGAIATLAGTLALLGAVLNLIGVGRLGLDFLHDPGDFDNSLAYITLLGGLLTAAMLTYGAILIFRHDETGRFTVIVTCWVWAAIGVVGLALALVDYSFEYGVEWFAGTGPVAESLFALTGIVGAVTALLDADPIAALAALAPPVLTALAATPRYPSDRAASRSAA